MSVTGGDRPAINPWLIAPVVALAAFMEILDISIANVSLPHIAGDLSSSQDESTWVLTSYLVTNAVMMPITGWLSNRFGRKRFFLVCIASFTLASFLCGVAPDLTTLIILRAIQGAAGGGLQPSGQAILADSFPVHKRGMATAIYGIAAVFAPAIGPTLGGFITDNYSWRWVFLINVPVGVILTILVGAVIHEPHDQSKANGRSIDWLGFALVALSLGCIQVVLDRGQTEDWFGSLQITILTIISATSFVTLIWWELHTDEPIVNLRLLKNRDFAASFGLMLMLGFMLLGSTFLIPAYAQSLMGYTATDAGLVLTPGGLVVLMVLPFVGRMVNKVDTRLLIAIGLILYSVGLFWMTDVNLDSSFNVMMTGRILQGSGLAFLFIPINNVAFRAIDRTQTNNASALVNLARNFGGSVGISFASTMLVRREQFHQSRLVEYLNPLTPAYTDLTARIGHVVGQGPGVVASIYQSVVGQATLLAYLEDFKVMGWIAILLIPLLLFVRAGHSGKPVAVH
jgi:DHA2 family multidrug resistance protein